MKSLLTLIIILLPTVLFAQKQEIITVEPRTDLTKTVDRQYLFPEFNDGKVIFKDNNVATSKLNYNMLLNEIQFIDGKNDTLSLSNQQNVALITIGKSIMVNVKTGFGLVLAQKGLRSLSVKKNIIAKEPPKKGAYGSRSETTAITQYNSISSSGTEILLPVEVELRTSLTYYLVEGTKVNIATKKNFLKMFSNHKKAIEEYLKTNKINFDKEEDLIQLFNYCVNLQ